MFNTIGYTEILLGFTRTIVCLSVRYHGESTNVSHEVERVNTCALILYLMHTIGIKYTGKSLCISAE